MRYIFVALVLSLAAPAAGQPRPPVAPLERLMIVAGAAPGGGWDQTARVIQQVVLTEGLARVVQVENIAGAAGTIGLARFIKSARRDEPALLVTGLVMQAAIIANQAPVSLGRVTPVACLAGEYEVIAVPDASPFRTLADLIAAFRRDPGSVSWAGGSAGGTDQLLVGLVAREAGVAPWRANYVAFAGGGEAAAALLGNQVSAGIAGLSEFTAHLASGRLRALAISGPERLPGSDVPTFVEQGLNVILTNWRGLVGPPNATPALRATLRDLVDRVHRSASWREALVRYGWMDLYLPDRAFADFLASEQRTVESILLSLRAGTNAAPLSRTGAAVFPTIVGVGLLVIGIALAIDVRRTHAEGKTSGAASAPSTTRWRSLGYLAFGAVASLAALETAGFVASSAILFWSTARAFGSVRWLRDLTIGVTLALVTYVVFTRGLSLSLPSGVLSGWL